MKYILTRRKYSIMKILITGANGFVGHKLMQMTEGAIAAPSLRGLDQDSITRIIEDIRPDAIVHTAAISDIGTCEKDPEASYLANVLIPARLANASRGIKLVCFSSDQVYSASPFEGPYTESDTGPGNTYARHKLEMEERVLDIDPDAVMLRAEWMYDLNSARPNYLDLVLNSSSLQFSSHEYRGVTYLKDVAANINNVIKLPGGAYNFGSETDISIYEVTKMFAGYIGRDMVINDCEPAHNLWMDCSKAASNGVIFPSVIDGLKQSADDYNL